MLKILRNSLSCVTHANTKTRKLQIFKYTTGSQKTKAISAVLSTYTEDESGKLLEIINTLKLPDHERYNLTKGRASKLLEWRNRHGPFRELNDILLVDGFGVKVADKFYQSILRGPSNVEGKDAKLPRLRYASFITPIFDPEKRQKVRSSVALRVGVSSVSWSRLEVPAAELHSPFLLTHWQHHEITAKKLHLQDLVEQCLSVDQQIPDADCYLFENPQMAQPNRNPGNAEQQNISIQKSQITASLCFALNRRCYAQGDDSGRSKVYYLRRFLTARLFSHLVGTERVSSEATVLKMMRTHYNKKEDLDYVLDEEFEISSSDKNQAVSDLSIRGEILFPSELRQMFATSERYHREFLGQCLLLNLAFVRLAVLQDPASIAVINRKSSKEPEHVVVTLT